MEPFRTHTGLVAPLARSNVDTDAIIPKQYLKSVQRTGFGAVLFDDWRYAEPGTIDSDHTKRAIHPDFVLNDARYKNASILLTEHNFGCGSSREHAPWALRDFGFRVLLAVSFADIFFNNCIKNGLVPICLDASIIDTFFVAARHEEGLHITVDLPAQTITEPKTGRSWPFAIAPFVKTRLLEGLDDIGMTMRHEDAITAFETQHQSRFPWLFSRVKT